MSGYVNTENGFVEGRVCPDCGGGLRVVKCTDIMQGDPPMVSYRCACLGLCGLRGPLRDDRSAAFGAFALYFLADGASDAGREDSVLSRIGELRRLGKEFFVESVQVIVADFKAVFFFLLKLPGIFVESVKVGVSDKGIYRLPADDEASWEKTVKVAEGWGWSVDITESVKEAVAAGSEEEGGEKEKIECYTCSGCSRVVEFSEENVVMSFVRRDGPSGNKINEMVLNKHCPFCKYREPFGVVSVYSKIEVKRAKDSTADDASEKNENSS